MNKYIEKRKYPRVSLRGYTADITRGSVVYTAAVRDASFNGIQLNELPKKFTATEEDLFNIVVSNYADARHHKLQVQPRWEQKGAFSAVVGFNIIRAPASWNNLILQELPLEEKKKNSPKRKDPRVKLIGYSADITDGSSIYTATVRDASFGGIQLNDLPKKFTATEKSRFNIVVSGYADSTHYKLQVQPRWRRQGAFSTLVGFNILNAPAGWNSLILQELPLEEKKKNSPKREHPRVPLRGYTADITHGSSVYTAAVRDASFGGIQLYDLPKKFTATEDELFSIVVSGYADSTHHKLQVQPRWRQQGSFSVIVGFSIIRAPKSWNKLILQQLPAEEKEDLKNQERKPVQLYLAS
ncbi:MAG: PilZ domain-containing protein [Candidatus Electrothrix sp. YB6]